MPTRPRKKPAGREFHYWREGGPGRQPRGPHGERTSEYRRVMVRLPDDAHHLLDALARHLAAPKWQVIATALRAYATRKRL